MDESRLLKVLKQAQKIADEIDDPYKVTTFELIANYLLRNTFEETSISDKTKVRLAEKSKKVTTQPSSLPELFKLSNAKSHTEKALIIAYYLLKNKGLDSFNVNHVKSEFSRARQPKPGNTSDVLNSLIKKGWLASSGRKIDNLKGYYITTLGEEQAIKMLTEGK